MCLFKKSVELVVIFCVVYIQLFIFDNYVIYFDIYQLIFTKIILLSIVCKIVERRYVLFEDVNGKTDGQISEIAEDCMNINIEDCKPRHLINIIYI